jgi:hypothetical protein
MPMFFSAPKPAVDHIGVMHVTAGVGSAAASSRSEDD